jgi:uncharacterized membrane protein HdeD (DUF308 family)
VLVLVLGIGIGIGIACIIEGVSALVATVPTFSRWFDTLVGAAGMVAGIVVLCAPMESVGVLVLLGSGFLIISGAVQLMAGFTFGRQARAASISSPATASPATRVTA